MKRINLITPKVYFPVPLPAQKQAAVLMLVLSLGISGYSTYVTRNRLDAEKTRQTELKRELEIFRKSVVEKRAVDDKIDYIEKEFKPVAADYQVLNKNVVAKDVFRSLAGLVPANTWITSIEFNYDSQKILRIQGKSFSKEEVFHFMRNAASVGKNAELLNLQAEGTNFMFECTLELT